MEGVGRGVCGCGCGWGVVATGRADSSPHGTGCALSQTGGGGPSPSHPPPCPSASCRASRHSAPRTTAGTACARAGGGCGDLAHGLGAVLQPVPPPATPTGISPALRSQRPAQLCAPPPLPRPLWDPRASSGASCPGWGEAGPHPICPSRHPSVLDPHAPPPPARPAGSPLPTRRPGLASAPLRAVVARRGVRGMGKGAWAAARRVNLHHGALDKRLCAHKLVVGGVVDDVEDARLPRAHLRPPREVPRVQPDAAELHVAAAAAHRVDALRANLGHRHLAAHLMLALLVVVRLLAARQPPLVLRIARDAHGRQSACPEPSC